MIDYKHNDLGFCCLSDENHEKLFGYEPAEPLNLNPDLVELRRLEHFEPFPEKPLPELPKLPYGNDVEEYFQLLAQNFFNRYSLDDKIDQLLSINKEEVYFLRQNLDVLIDNARANVWTKLDIEGNLTELEFPDSNSSIFDTETFVLGSSCNSPIVGQALGKDKEGTPSLYMWLHPSFDRDDEEYVPQKVSIGENKLLIGHSFSFDRQKIKEVYSFKKTKNIFLCTMAMMMQVGGLPDGQRWAAKVDPLKNWKAAKIQRYGCAMGLVPSYEFITGRDLPPDSKKLRDIFKKAKTFQEFRDSRHEILTYSMLDVIYNWELFVGVWDQYLKMINHKAIIAGQAIVIDSIVPHIDYWDDWVDRCDTEYGRIEQQIYNIIFPKVKKVHDKWLETGIETIEGINWDYVRPYRHRKDKPLPDGWELRTKWFEPWRKGDIKLKGRDIGLLLQCEYKFEEDWHTVHYTRKNAFHIIVGEDIVKLPNRKKPGENFGNILSADSYDLIKKGVLRSKLLTDEEFLEVLRLFNLTTTYTGFRNRVVAQNKENGLIGAEVRPCGTISGKQTCPLKQ